MPSALHLNGKTLLVTGASSGIGAEVCRQAAAAGATVIAAGRNAERLAATLSDLQGTGHTALAANLTDDAASEAMAGRLPVLDGVVHCAGIHRYLPMKMVSPSALAEQFRLNLEAPLLLTRLLLTRRLLRPGGAIVFISSLAAFRAVPANGIYSATKAALIAAARVLALELAGQRIRVNCVAPGMVRTPLSAAMTAAVSAADMALHEREYPLGFGEPADVAGSVVFLLSDAARWMTGQCLVLDGGFSAR